MAKNKKGKGKVQNGRAAQKGKAQKRASNFFIQDDDYEDAPKGFRGFSGAPRKDSRARPGIAQYRHLPMSFVSAGASNSATPPNNESREVDTSSTTAPPAAIRPEVEDEDPDSGAGDEEDDEEDDDDNNIQTNIMMDVHLDMDMDNMQINATDSRASSNRAAYGDDSRLDGAISASNVDMVMDVDEQPAFIIDMVGDSTLDAGGFHGKLPAQRAVSPAGSDSSEEVIFSGRSGMRSTVVNDPVTRTITPKQATSRQPARQTSPHPTDDLLFALSQPTAPSIVTSSSSKLSTISTRSAQHKTAPTARQSPLDALIRPQDEWAPAPQVPYWKKLPSKARPDLNPNEVKVQAFADAPERTSKVELVEATLTASVKGRTADVASLQADWKSVLDEKKKTKKIAAESEDDIEFSTAKGNRRGKRGRKRDNRAIRKAIDSDDNDSFGEAAYDDYMENLQAQADAEDEACDEGNTMFKFAFAARSSANLGPSMVVDGKEIADDEVLPKSTKKTAAQEAALDAADDDSLWESDSSALKPNPDEISSDEDLSYDSSDLEDDVEYTERQRWEDEDDIRQRRLDRMTDEQIARLLSKQEELGMPGDEILLEDDGAWPYTPEWTLEEGVGDVEAARVGLYDITNNSIISNKRGMRRSRHDRKHNFPDASALADTVEQYGEHGFDIMDFDRPSLRPTRRGRKGKMPPELEMLSDEELQATMDDAWRNDRMKKAQKKLEREQLRREGLLGSAGRKGKSDLNAKYPQGMTMVEVHHELRIFLEDEDLYERSFPPLAKAQRKSLHEIAVALNLNSRSQGGGKNRFPIVYKTSRTEEYSPDMFNKIMNASGHGFLTRGAAKKMAKGKAGARGGGFGKGNSMRVANGQIVGAGAAEIGHESMGHKLMMKMGWSKGQGLGKEGEGMKTPVEQKVRLGTAGLG